MVVVLLLSSLFVLFVPPRAAAAILTGSSASPTTVDLSWTPECLSAPPTYPCNGAGTRGYTIYLKNGSYQGWWENVEDIFNIAVTTYTVIGLQPATTYQFYVRENLAWSSFNSNIITVQTLPPPNEGPSLSIVAPAGGMTFTAGQTVEIRWAVGDDHDPPQDIVVYLNYTGPTSGRISGPLSGLTTSLEWTIPSSLVGSGYRVTAVAIDSEGSWRVAESAAFSVSAPPGEPGGGGAVWVFSTAILSVIVAGLTAGLLLAVRVQLGEWFRRAREKRRGRTQ